MPQIRIALIDNSISVPYHQQKIDIIIERLNTILLINVQGAALWCLPLVCLRAKSWLPLNAAFATYKVLDMYMHRRVINCALLHLTNLYVKYLCIYFCEISCICMNQAWGHSLHIVFLASPEGSIFIVSRQVHDAQWLDDASFGKIKSCGFTKVLCALLKNMGSANLKSIYIYRSVS